VRPICFPQYSLAVMDKPRTLAFQWKALLKRPARGLHNNDVVGPVIRALKAIDATSASNNSKANRGQPGDGYGVGPRAAAYPYSLAASAFLRSQPPVARQAPERGDV
jgi:hypothetical protein